MTGDTWPEVAALRKLADDCARGNDTLGAAYHDTRASQMAGGRRCVDRAVGVAEPRDGARPLRGDVLPVTHAPIRVTVPAALLDAYRLAGAAVPALSHAAAQGLRDALERAGLPVPPDPPPTRTAKATRARWRPPR